MRDREPVDVGTTWREEPIRSDVQDDLLLLQESLEPAAAAGQLPMDEEPRRELPPELWLQPAEHAAARKPNDVWAPLIPWRVVLPAALAALVLVALGKGILAMGGWSHISPVAPVVGTATAAATAPTAVTTPTPLPAPPNLTIEFGVTATPTNNQQCIGTDPLDPLTVTLVNSSSAVAVDWFASITDATPDGKLPWAVAADPYGTLRVGQTATVMIIPDPSLCGQLAQKGKPVTYHVNIMYAAIGAYAITDTITPSAIVPPLGG